MRIEGKYNYAIVFTDELEKTAYEQIENLTNQEFVKDSKIRIMPDVHAGAGCTIGTTMTIVDKVVPNLVGVDIGCGIETIKLEERNLKLEKMDKLIYSRIPSGFNIRKRPHEYNDRIDLYSLKCAGEKDIDIDRAIDSLGTLGGGNHFIEVGKDEEGYLYLEIHSGSRNIGLQVAKHYQNLAYKLLQEKEADGKIEETIKILKEHGREEDIEAIVKQMKREKPSVEKNLAYLEGKAMDDYLHDMQLMQKFATLNRKAMADVIIENMELNPIEEFTTIHNYIEMDTMILRKGAVSAKDGEKFLIPINMRDGSLVCIGKGNPEWNYSAPHGAGRLMSRREAKSSLSLDKFREQMEGVYTTSVHRGTLDEAPRAYKDIDHIIKNIDETATIVNRLRPIYNFKAQ